MRQTGGTILVTSGLVHLDPTWINKLLRALLDHSLIDATDARKVEFKDYSRRNSLAYGRLTQTHENFIRTGRLTETYLRFLWRDIPEIADGDVFQRMVSTLSHHGAMFRCEGSGGIHLQELMVPARLPARIEAETLSQLQHAICNGVRMQITIEIDSEYVPAGVIAHFLGTFSSSIDDISFRSCWNRGAAFSREGIEYLICLHEPTAGRNRRIQIDVAGSSRETVSKPGNALKDALTTSLIHHYRGLLLDWSTPPKMSDGRRAWQDSVDALKEHLERQIDKVCLMSSSRSASLVLLSTADLSFLV